MANFAQAKRVPAGFGYSHVMVGNTLVFTTKIRTKQFDLLRYAIEHKRRNENKLQGTYGQLKMNKNRQTYVTYEFVSTDANAMSKFQQEMDEARAEVLEIKALRLKMQNPWYEPIWLTTIRDAINREECKSYATGWVENDELDLPF